MLSIERLHNILSYDFGTGYFRWNYDVSSRVRKNYIAGVIEKNGYRRIKIDGKRYLAHRLSWFYVRSEWPRINIDHIDGNRDNNAFYNLRLATQSQNKANQSAQKNNLLGLKSVSYRHGLKKPYTSKICVNGKIKRLGYFATADEAYSAYITAAIHNFGEYARII